MKNTKTSRSQRNHCCFRVWECGRARRQFSRNLHRMHFSLDYFIETGLCRFCASDRRRCWMNVNVIPEKLIRHRNIYVRETFTFSAFLRFLFILPSCCFFFRVVFFGGTHSTLVFTLKRISKDRVSEHNTNRLETRKRVVVIKNVLQLLISIFSDILNSECLINIHQGAHETRKAVFWRNTGVLLWCLSEASCCVLDEKSISSGRSLIIITVTHSSAEPIVYKCN